MKRLQPGEQVTLSEGETESSLKNTRITCRVYLGCSVLAVCVFVYIAWLCFFGGPLEDPTLTKVFVAIGVFACASCVAMASVAINMVIELKIIAAKLRRFR